MFLCLRPSKTGVKDVLSTQVIDIRYISAIFVKHACSDQWTTMQRYIAAYNPYYLFILTIDYSKNFTTRYLQNNTAHANVCG